MDDLIQTGEGTYVNKRFLSDEGRQQAESFGSLPLSTATLTSTASIRLPEVKQGTSADALVGAAQGVVEGTDSVLAQSDLQVQADQETQAQQAKVNQGETEQRGLLQRILGLGAEQQQMETDAGIPDLAKAVTEARKQVTSARNALIVSQRAQTNEIRALEGVGLTDVQKAASVREINRKYAFEQADLSLNQLVANASLEGANLDLTTAQSIVDKKIALIKEPLEIAYKYYGDFLDRNYSILDKKEQRAFELKRDEQKRALDQIDEFKKTQNALMQSATAQGAPASVVANIAKARNAQEAYQAAGIYSGDVLDRQYKQAQINKLLADVEKAKAENSPAGASELKTQALTSAKDLLTKFNSGQGTAGVGKFGTVARFVTGLFGGTDVQDFQVQFDNLKSLLSLDNVKFLKGQGQVSDAERRLLEQASAKLNLAQSEPEFKKALEDINKALGGGGDVQVVNGVRYVKAKDGLYYPE